MVSLSVSPLEVEVLEASENPITRPPRRFTAVSKLSRVRVDGSKKRVATTFPSSRRRLGRSSNFWAVSSRLSISSRLKSLIDTRLLVFIAVKCEVHREFTAKLLRIFDISMSTCGKILTQFLLNLTKQARGPTVDEQSHHTSGQHTGDADRQHQCPVTTGCGKDDVEN